MSILMCVALVASIGAVESLDLCPIQNWIPGDSWTVRGWDSPPVYHTQVVGKSREIHIQFTVLESETYEDEPCKRLQVETPVRGGGGYRHVLWFAENGGALLKVGEILIDHKGAEKTRVYLPQRGRPYSQMSSWHIPMGIFAWPLWRASDRKWSTNIGFVDEQIVEHSTEHSKKNSQLVTYRETTTKDLIPSKSVPRQAIREYAQEWDVANTGAVSSVLTRSSMLLHDKGKPQPSWSHTIIQVWAPGLPWWQKLTYHHSRFPLEFRIEFELVTEELPEKYKKVLKAKGELKPPVVVPLDSIE